MRLVLTMAAAALVNTSAMAMDVCSGGNRTARLLTCLVDGDTGWEQGEKWRLIAIDTPEIQHNECSVEFQKAHEARDRLSQLMDTGYQLNWEGKRDRNGRKLVNVILSDGRDAGEVLLHEHLAQPWPNTGNVWCGRQ